MLSQLLLEQKGSNSVSNFQSAVQILAPEAKGTITKKSDREFEMVRG